MPKSLELFSGTKTTIANRCSAVYRALAELYFLDTQMNLLSV